MQLEVTSHSSVQRRKTDEVVLRHLDSLWTTDVVLEQNRRGPMCLQFPRNTGEKQSNNAIPALENREICRSHLLLINTL